MADPKNPASKPAEGAPRATESEPAEAIDRGRRRLLGMATYIPPAVLGIISLQQAGCQPAPSCNPATCSPATQPCQPDSNPCSPNTGCNPDTCNPNV